ncbi:hypothetical protein ACJX0J_030805, partial [Zea mays]
VISGVAQKYMRQTRLNHAISYIIYNYTVAIAVSAVRTATTTIYKDKILDMFLSLLNRTHAGPWIAHKKSDGQC